ncbi:hypothetical protein F4553_004466 [Allocatelliglobosispora scoriae]|uniref:Replication initiation protein n=1 Tax=Allocatelliglobosispora scoriae TaxID=643052 RepID=A0A841BPT8_9ACTN|nr:hypothetical protein [Allocatelliglobosispora scoriae]
MCVRPIPLKRTDHETGLWEIVDIPCGARLASVCAPCAEKQRKLRMQQIREGWHLTTDPTDAITVETPADEVKALVLDRCQLVFDREEAVKAADPTQVARLDVAIDLLDEQLSGMRVRGTLPSPADPASPRRTRSTRRRQDTTDLPRLPVDSRTTGKVYTTPDGRKVQPSTLLTITLDSYGPVHTGSRTRRGKVHPCQCGHLHHPVDPALGTPIDPDTYDYRRAALDAIFFAAGLDRFWQNLRRAAGLNLQYAGAVEMQKRLAPHVHYAMRGTLPKALLRQVAAATYHQVWWPQFDVQVYTVAKPPVWDHTAECYTDPTTGEPLQTWAEALDALDDEDAEPAYVLRLGKIDARGITHGTKDAERSVRYVTKYVTKDLAEQADPSSATQKAHYDRLHEELATLPCSPTCANWLLYGVQPDKAKQGLTPGRCSGKVHQRKTLGFTGRRVLISRQWSGKTLKDHRADNAAWVRTVLAGAPEGDALPTDTAVDRHRYSFAMVRNSDPGVPDLQVRIMRAIAQRELWRRQVYQAQQPPDPVPATGTSALALAA